MNIYVLFVGKPQTGVSLLIMLIFLKAYLIALNKVKHTHDQKVLGSLYFGLPRNENLTITFQYNLPLRQCN